LGFGKTEIFFAKGLDRLLVICPTGKAQWFSREDREDQFDLFEELGRGAQERAGECSTSPALRGVPQAEIDRFLGWGAAAQKASEYAMQQVCQRERLEKRPQC
jgi:hypothetical protein